MRYLLDDGKLIPASEFNRPMTERELAVLIHAGMKQLGWQRFDSGGTMANDDKPAILVNAKTGQSFVIEVREV